MFDLYFDLVHAIPGKEKEVEVIAMEDGKLVVHRKIGARIVEIISWDVVVKEYTDANKQEYSGDNTGR